MMPSRSATSQRVACRAEWFQNKLLRAVRSHDSPGQRHVTRGLYLPWEEGPFSRVTEVMVNGPDDVYVEREGRIERLPSSGRASPLRGVLLLNAHAMKTP